MQNTFNHVFDKENSWFTANGLRLNCAKTQVIRFKTTHDLVNVQLKIQFSGEVTNVTNYQICRHSFARQSKMGRICIYSG